MEEKIEFTWRIKLGLVIFVISLIVPYVLAPLVVFMGLSGPLTATIAGGLYLSGEIMGIASIALLGKDGYRYIKNYMSGLCKLYKPSDKVSKTRYRIGLVMFFMPLLFGWVYPYLASFTSFTGEFSLTYAIFGDLLLLASFFVLGGDFWDKIAALFSHNTN